MSKWLVALGLLLSMTLLAACGGKTPLEKVLDSVSDQVGSGSDSGEGSGDAKKAAKVPAGFPLKIPPGAQITEGVTFTLDDVVNYSVEYDILQPVAELYDFYKEDLANNGVTETLNMSTEDDDEESAFFIGGNETNSIVMEITKKHDEELTHVFMNWSAPKK